MYSTFVIAPVPVGTSMLEISRQMRWPALNWFAVARISILYSTTSPGFTGLREARVSLWNGLHGFDRASSSARYDALSHPRVSSRSGRPAGPSPSPSRAGFADATGPHPLGTTSPLGSVWAVAGW